MKENLVNKNKIAVLCIAHIVDNNFKLLIEVLTKDFDVFVHFDKKNEESYSNEISKIEQAYKNKVFFIKNNVVVFWGGFSQIQAELALLRASINSSQKYSHFLLISGADFPIKSNQYIYRFLKQNQNQSFIQFNKLPTSAWGMNGGLDRYQRFWLTDFKNRQHTRIIGRLTVNFQKILRIKRKNYFKEYYGGANWANLSYDAATYIFELIDSDEQVLKSFKWTRACDEVWKQTILNSSSQNALVNDSLRYVDWSGKYPPKVLDSFDYDKLMASNALFARKMNGNDLTLQKKLLESFENEQ